MGTGIPWVLAYHGHSHIRGYRYECGYWRTMGTAVGRPCRSLATALGLSLALPLPLPLPLTLPLTLTLTPMWASWATMSSLASFRGYLRVGVGDYS